MAALRLLGSSVLLGSAVLRQSRQIGRIVPRRSRLLSTTYSIKKSDDTIPPPIDQITGLEKMEHEAILDGVLDPFFLEAPLVPQGTKSNPTLVPSMYEERIIGCGCDEESNTVTWIILKKGKVQRCLNCGSCFQLVDGEPGLIVEQDSH